MKFSHTARFRRAHPGARRRRNIPVLRVFLLVGCGAFVYARFDSIWSRLRPARRAASAPMHDASYSGPESLPLRFNADSTEVSVDCRGVGERACCGSLARLSPSLRGETEAVLAKARWRHALEGRILLTGIRLRILSEGPEKARILALEGRDGKGAFRYARALEAEGPGAGIWCDSRRGCLARPAPRPALRNAFYPEVFPVLPGRVTRVDSVGPGLFRVAVYHGRELYTVYDPLVRVAAGLKAGSPADPLRPLGDAVADSVGNPLHFQAVQAGMPLDPEDFFAAEVSSHGP